MSLYHVFVVLLPIGALTAAAALVFQLLTLTIRVAVSNAVWWSRYFIDHPLLEAAGRAQLSWRDYSLRMAWRIGAIALLFWGFLQFRHEYLELLDAGHLGPVMTLAREYLLALTILAFLKASLYVALFLVLLPVLVIWSNHSQSAWFKKLVAFSRHHAPKVFPFLVYYGLLVIAVSLVINPRILARFPFHMPWETFGRTLRQDVVLQLMEFRDWLLGLFRP